MSKFNSNEVRAAIGLFVTNILNTLVLTQVVDLDATQVAAINGAEQDLGE